MPIPDLEPTFDLERERERESWKVAVAHWHAGRNGIEIDQRRQSLVKHPYYTYLRGQIMQACGVTISGQGDDGPLVDWYQVTWDDVSLAQEAGQISESDASDFQDIIAATNAERMRM